MIRGLFALTTALLLSACGYHLVGHGEGSGAIPQSVHQLDIRTTGEGLNLALELKRQLQDRDRAVSINQGDGDAELQLLIRPFTFAPAAYDANGIANQYRMTYSGSLKLVQAGKVLWQSGTLSERGEVYVNSSPASIEAGKQQLLKGLRRQWLRTALARLRSGF